MVCDTKNNFDFDRQCRQSIMSGEADANWMEREREREMRERER